MGSNQQLCLATSVAKKLKIMPNSGILYLSVQKNPYHNPPGKFTSVVIDCERRNLMPNYPRNVKEKPKEKRVKPSPTSKYWSLWSHGYVVSYLHLPKIRPGINETTEEVGQNNLITSYDISALKEVARLV